MSVHGLKREQRKLKDYSMKKPRVEEGREECSDSKCCKDIQGGEVVIGCVSYGYIQLK